MNQYLQPGILLVGNISMSGCSTYERTAKESQIDLDNQVKENWHTYKTTRSVREQQDVQVQRSRLAARIARLGVHIGNFGYLIPQSKLAELAGTIETVQNEIRSYNATARFTQLDYNFAGFRIEASDVRVARTLYSKISTLFERAAEAFDQGDLPAFRRAFQDLSSSNFESMLPTDASKRLQEEIERARKAARQAAKNSKDLDDPEAKAKTVKEFLTPLNIERTRGAYIEIRDETRQATANPISLLDPRCIELPIEPDEEAPLDQAETA